MSTVQHPLGFTEPHILVRIGDVSFIQDEPHFHCWFLQWDGRNVQPPSSFISLPHPHVIDLRPSDILKPSGERSIYPKGKVFTTKVRVEKGLGRNRERAELAEEGILPTHPVFEAHDVAGTSRTYWRVLEALSPSVDRIVVANLELFISYQASNSRLMGHYFSSEITYILASLMKDKRNRREGDVCYLYLPKGHLVSDVVPLARILFDQTDIADTEAQRVANSMKLARRRNEPFSIECGFPFSGETMLTYRAIEHTNDTTGEKIHLVLELLCCSFPLPWARLEVDLEQSIATQSKEKGQDNGRSGGAVYEDFDEPFVPLDPNAPEPTRGDEFVGKTPRKMVFQSSAEGSIKIHRRATNTTRPDGSSPNWRKNKHFSSHKGNSEGDQGSRSTQVAPNGDGVSETEESKDRTHYTSPIAALRSVTQSLADLTLDGYKVAPVPTTGACRVYEGFLLEEIPITADPPSSRTWKWITSGKQRRCLLRVHVSKDDFHVYAHEIVRNPTEAFSTLLAYAPNGDELPNHIVDEVLYAIHRKEGLPDDKPLEQRLGIRLSRVRHPWNTQPDRQPLRAAISDLFQQLAART